MRNGNIKKKSVNHVCNIFRIKFEKNEFRGNTVKVFTSLTANCYIRSRVDVWYLLCVLRSIIQCLYNTDVKSYKSVRIPHVPEKYFFFLDFLENLKSMKIWKYKRAWWYSIWDYFNLWKC